MFRLGDLALLFFSFVFGFLGSDARLFFLLPFRLGNLVQLFLMGTNAGLDLQPFSLKLLVVRGVGELLFLLGLFLLVVHNDLRRRRSSLSRLSDSFRRRA